MTEDKTESARSKGQKKVMKIQQDDTSSEIEMSSTDVEEEYKLKENNVQDNAGEDADDDSDEDGDAVDQEQLEKFDFFDTLGEIPEVNQISLDSIDDLSKQKPNELERESTLTLDLGKVIDPLHSTPSIKSIQEDFPISEESEMVDQQSLYHTDDIIQEVIRDDAVDEIDEVQHVRQTIKIEDGTFELFLEALKQKEVKYEDDIEEAAAAIMREKEEREIQANVAEFLSSLIDQSVATAEYLDSDKILRTFLDKRKLIIELKTKCDSLDLGRTVSRFVNRKAVEYFKRKNAMRSIFPDESSSLISHRNKYHDALFTLDKWLNKEEKTKNFHSSQVLNLRSQFEKAKQQSYKEVDKLEQLLKSTLQRKGFEKLQAAVNKHLDKMSVLRKEISAIRLTLFLKQHQFSSLKKQMESFEDLGDGLNVHQFESLETETTALSKKIEENNSTLRRFHNRFEEDLHKMAHLREKHKMLRNLVIAQHQYLAELMAQKKDMREHINQHKYKHLRRRSEIRQLTSQSGLLFKPALIKDYDKMTETANNLRQTNDELTNAIQELNVKIAVLKKNCAV